MTSQLAPAAIASAAVRVRFWSSGGSVTGPDAGRDQLHGLRDELPQISQFQRRAYQSAQPGLDSQGRQTFDLTPRVGLETDLAQFVAVHAGQHRDAQQYGAGRPSDWAVSKADFSAAFNMAVPPLAWTVAICTSSRCGGRNRLGHSIGNVVKLEIQKNRRARGSNRRYDSRAGK